MNTTPIFFLGGGHGGQAALQSLQSTFATIEIVTSDADTLKLCRPSDYVRKNLDSVATSCGVMAGHLGMLSRAFLAQHTVLNVHYSLLPRYRGLHSVVWAMLNLETEIGLTVHLANEQMDDGPIIYQHKICYSGQTSREIMQHFNMHIIAALGGVLEKWLAGRIQATPQDERLATWVPRRNLEDCFVDFSWSVDRLRAFFKALVPPYPLPALMIRGHRFEILEARLDYRPYFCDLGRVVNVDADGVWIKCMDSLLVVSRLLAADGVEHLASNALKIGQRLRCFRHD